MDAATMTTIARGELVSLAQAKAGVPNALSPLHLFALPSGTSPAAAPAKSSVPVPADLLVRLSRPDWTVTIRMGGGDWPIQELVLCGQSDGGAVTGIRPSGTMDASLFGWASPEAFSAWWCGQFAHRGEEDVPNPIPPSCSLEAFLMMLQAVDAYRRALMLATLAHRPSTDLRMTAADFNAACRSSIAARDIRWLAAAFMLLVPGLGAYKLAGGAESLKPAYDRDFLATFADGEKGAQQLGFGQVGQMVGLEFARGWQMAAGYESRTAAPEGIRAVARGFVAPTALTNHFVRLEPLADGRANANHQTMGFTEMNAALTGVLREAVQAARMPAGAHATGTANASLPGSPAAGGDRFCHQCGTKLDAGASFCLQCGTRQE